MEAFEEKLHVQQAVLSQILKNTTALWKYIFTHFNT